MMVPRRLNWWAGLILTAGLALLVAGCPLLTDFGLGTRTTDADIPATVPAFSAANFTNPTQIDHAHFPLVVGSTRRYTAATADGAERIVVEVLDETRAVLGVVCRVVRDRVFLDDVLIEDTHDWYAQDDAGNVWYMGEEVDNYAYDDEGNLLEITHEGAWEAGQDVVGLGSVAQPGYAMKASPAAGDRYHQEFYAGQAEYMAEIVAVAVAVTLSDGTSYTCLKTRDFSSLDPDLNEYKYYAPAVGLVLEEAVAGGARTELVSAAP